MGKWILKDTTLKTQFHIALFERNSDHIALFFQGRISAMPEIRAELLLGVSKTGMCLLTLSVFKCFTILVPS